MVVLYYWAKKLNDSVTRKLFVLPLIALSGNARFRIVSIVFTITVVCVSVIASLGNGLF